MQGAADSTQRMEAVQVMLARYGQENERLAAINEALVSRRAFVDSDYTSKLFIASCRTVLNQRQQRASTMQHTSETSNRQTDLPQCSQPWQAL